MQSLINPNNTVKLLKTRTYNANCCLSGFAMCQYQVVWVANMMNLSDKETNMSWGKTLEPFWQMTHFSCICAATMQFRGCAGSPVTLQFYSIRSVPEYNSQLIWRWLWRWPLWRSAVWSQPQSKCPWMKYRSLNCSPRQLLPTQSFCVFICPKEQEAPRIMQF